MQITAINGTTYGGKLNLDDVEIGDILSPTFKPHVKMRRWNGLCDMTISYPTTSAGLIMYDGVNHILRYPVDNNTNIEISGIDPKADSPEGAIELNVILKKKPNKNTITLKLESDSINFKKILPLDVEYDQAACLDHFPKHPGTFTITPTQIIHDATGEVMKTRDERLCNSYRGRAKQNYQVKSELGEIKKGPNKGKQLTYTNVSRTTAHIKRGKPIDADGWEVWVEDMNLDPDGTLTIKLPSDFVKNAKYPIRQAVGLDPAYTEDMDSWVTDTFGDADNTWSDYDLHANKGVPHDAVAEIILSNQETGVENTMGVRTDGSSLARYVTLHEAEGGGVTTCRMFVLNDVTTGNIECYHSDVSDDDSYYLLGYWENVTFTERFDDETPSSSGAWDEEALVVGAGAADKVCHFLLRNQEQDVANTMGIRNTSSAVNRYILVHEPETGGESILDMITKADSSQLVDFYTEDNANTVITCAGYFGAELDFVELFQSINHTVNNTWETQDVTAYLDEDGRITDWLLAHEESSAAATVGVRDGDDSTTERSILEHEAETDGSSTHEVTGFGMSATTNASGEVQTVCRSASDRLHLMGYFKPAVGSVTVIPGIIALSDTEYIPPIGFGYIPGIVAHTTSLQNAIMNYGYVPTTLALNDTEYIPILKETIIPPILALLDTQYIPTVTVGIFVIPSTLALSDTEFIPPIGYGFIPSTLSLSDTEYIPILEETITPGILALVTSLQNALTGYGYIPSTLTHTTTKYIPVLKETLTPTTKALSLSFLIPVLKTGVIPSLVALSLSFFAPTVTGAGVALYSGMVKLRDGFKMVQRRVTKL